MNAPRRPAQIPLDLSQAPGLTRDHLAVSAANRPAVEEVERWPRWPSPILALVGPRGSGKSHLAGLWRETAGALALDANAIGAHGPALSRPVLIDDADRPGLDETGLFHLINALRAGGGQLLLTGRLPPASWDVRLPDLRSRLKTAAVAEIAPPDADLLEAVLAKLFADRQVFVEPAVMSYLLKRMNRSLAEAAKLVEALDQASMAGKRPITRALAADVLAGLGGGQPRGEE